MEAALKNSGLDRLACKRHAHGELWVICIHATPENAKAVLVKDLWVKGEVLCADCSVEMSPDKRSHDHLRVACGDCVRERFKLEDRS